MSNRQIGEIVSAANPESKSISGAELLKASAKAQNTFITAQLTPVAAGNFEIELEAAVNTQGSSAFTKIGSWDQDSDTRMSVLPVSMSVSYRFKRVSGVNCRCVLTG